MADEKDEALEEGGEPTVAPEELPATEGKPDEPSPYEPSPYDDLARQIGWTPKDEFKGDPENWKTAEQFIRDGHDIQRQQSRDLKELRSSMDAVAKTTAQIVADRIEQEKAKLSEQYAAAVEDGDTEKSFKIAQKLNGLDQQAQPSTQPAVQDFIERNRWFNSDPRATRLAVVTCEEFKNRPVSEQLEEAEKEVRRVYPHLFDKPNGGKPPASVSAPASRGATPSPKAKGFADMDPASQKIAKDMVERGVLPNTDPFVTRYWAERDKQGQSA